MRRAPVTVVMSVRPSTRFSANRFPWNLELETSVKTCSGNPYLVKIGLKKSGTLRGDRKNVLLFSPSERSLWQKCYQAVSPSSAWISAVPTGRIYGLYKPKFTQNLILGTYMKICRDFPNLVKKIWHFIWRFECALLLPETLNLHKSAVFEWNCIRLLGWPGGYKSYANAP